MNSDLPIDLSGRNLELLLALVEHIPAAALVIDNERLYCNRAAEGLTGYSGSEVETFTDWLQKVFGSAHAEMRALYEQDRAAGFPETREFMITRRDGSSRIVEFAASGREQVLCLMHDLTNRSRTERPLGTIQDITEWKQTENRLLQSEIKYRNLFDAATDAIFILDLDGRFVDVNRTAYTRLGYTKDELLSLHISQLDPPEFAELIPVRLKKVREKGEGVFESAHLRKDGSIMPVEVNCRLHDYEGRQVYFSVIRDISERKHTELLLRESEERYRRFSSLTTDYIYACRRYGREPYRVQWLGGAVEQITGYSIGEVMSWGCWMEIVHPDDVERVRSRLLVLEPGESRSDEFRIITKDGMIRWILEVCRCEQGKSPDELLLYGASRDITKRKDAETALREVETIFNLFLEYSPVYVFFKDENIRATQLSKNFEKMLGMPVDRIVGKSMDELFPRDFARKIVADDRKVLRDGVPIEIEEEFMGNSYKTFKFPIFLEGRSPLLAGFTVDITDLKKAQREVLNLNNHLERLVAERTEALERSNEDLAGFCYAVSHELRAPIARLQGFSAMLREASRGADETAFLASRIESASSHLQSVVDSILMLSRLSQVDLSLQEVNLSEIVASKLALLVADNPERRVALIIRKDVTVVADQSLMDICLDNLLGNAFKYTGQTTDAVIEFGVLDELGEVVYFVRDNGAGFDMSYYEKLYAPFQRLHQHKEFPGIGIGLATVKRIIERHGGEVWAESRVGEGASFFFTLGRRG